MLGEGYPVRVLWAEPFIAARCVDERTARSAAPAGSRLGISAIDLSYVAVVGDAFFGVVPIIIFRCEYARLGPWAVPGVVTGGDSVELSYE
jgi:hypothetical protein